MRELALGVIGLLAACSDSLPAGNGHGLPDAPQTALTPAYPHAVEGLPREVVDWVARSGWVFEATVTRLNDCTEPFPPWDPEGYWDLNRMIVVTIDGVARAPESAPLVPGTEHTVVLPEPPTLEVGARAYFFVSWLAAGESWVFLEVGQLADDAIDLSGLTGLVEEIESYLDDRAVYDRLIAADRVVAATVLDTRELPGPEVDNLPIWWEADVDVTSALRGPASVDRPVRFDGATTFCCYLRPKLEIGEQVILALFPDDQSDADGPGFLILDPLDKWATSERTRLESLLQAPPEPPL